MLRRWRRCTLGEVIELQRGYDLPTSDRQAGNIPVISSSGRSGWHDEAKALAPGVVTGRYGTIGQVHFVKQDFWPLNTTLYVRDFRGNDERFVSYLLQSLDFQSFNDKSSVPGLNRNDLHRTPVLIPPWEEQKEIAATLGSLDDKIEQNRRTGQSLERLARAIFKAWFVDFEPVKAKADGAVGYPGMPPAAFAALPGRLTDSPLGPVPKGWTTWPLSRVATFLNGLALQKYPPVGGGNDLPVIKIAELRKGSADGAGLANANFPDAYLIEDGDLLFSWSGTLEVEFWYGGRGALNQHLFKVTSDAYPAWLCFNWVRQHLPEFRLIAQSKATTMGHIKRGHLDDALVVVPDEASLRALDTTVAPMYELLANLAVESRKLAALRDYLLPRLLSGQVRVHGREGIGGGV